MHKWLQNPKHCRQKLSSSDRENNPKIVMPYMIQVQPTGLSFAQNNRTFLCSVLTNLLQSSAIYLLHWLENKHDTNSWTVKIIH